MSDQKELWSLTQSVVYLAVGLETLWKPFESGDPGQDRDSSYQSCDGECKGGSRFAIDE